MASEQSLALVLRTVDFSETSSVVTLFTREHGLVSALAKGARRPKSPFEVALDLAALCRVVFIPKPSDALALLTEAKLERRYRGADRGLAALYGGYYLIELLRELVGPHDPQPPLFDDAEATLDAMASGGHIAHEVIRFELSALRWLGHACTFTTCAETGVAVDLAGRVPFGLLAGGVLSPERTTGKSHVIQVRGEILRLLEVFARPDDDTWRDIALDRRTFGELRGVLNPYLTHLLGHPLRLHRYLGVLFDARPR